MTDLAQLGKDYALSHLEEGDLNPNPVQQFEVWLEEAMGAGLSEVNAMTLATVDKAGQVSVRMMLCKSFDDNGFVFFTNYNSRKGQALLAHPQAALQFWWPALERQVRIEGVTRQLDAAQSDAYFIQRDIESNIAAIISKQSQIMPDKQAFINQYEQLREQYQAPHQTQETTLPRPNYWGGFILEPTQFEFWQGGPHRLHDRLCYQKVGDSWKIVRLYP